MLFSFPKDFIHFFIFFVYKDKMFEDFLNLKFHPVAMSLVMFF